MTRRIGEYKMLKKNMPLQKNKPTFHSPLLSWMGYGQWDLKWSTLVKFSRKFNGMVASVSFGKWNEWSLNESGKTMLVSSSNIHTIRKNNYTYSTLSSSKGILRNRQRCSWPRLSLRHHSKTLGDAFRILAPKAPQMMKYFPSTKRTATQW